MRRQSDRAYDGRYVSYQGSDQSDYRHLINGIADVSGVVGVKGTRYTRGTAFIFHSVLISTFLSSVQVEHDTTEGGLIQTSGCEADLSAGRESNVDGSFRHPETTLLSFRTYLLFYRSVPCSGICQTNNRTGSDVCALRMSIIIRWPKLSL